MTTARDASLHGGCHVGMPVGDSPEQAQADGRSEWAKGQGCRAGCLHRSWVRRTLDELALAEHARQLRREEYLRGARPDGEEAREFDRRDRRITLKDAMVAQRQPREASA